MSGGVGGEGCPRRTADAKHRSKKCEVCGIYGSIAVDVAEQSVQPFLTIATSDAVLALKLVGYQCQNVIPIDQRLGNTGRIIRIIESDGDCVAGLSRPQTNQPLRQVWPGSLQLKGG